MLLSDAIKKRGASRKQAPSQVKAPAPVPAPAPLPPFAPAKMTTITDAKSITSAFNTIKGVTDFLRGMDTRSGEIYDASFMGHRYKGHWVAYPSNYTRQDDVSNLDVWYESYSRPLVREVLAKLDDRFGAGFFDVYVSDDGHINVEVRNHRDANAFTSAMKVISEVIDFLWSVRTSAGSFMTYVDFEEHAYQSYWVAQPFNMRGVSKEAGLSVWRSVYETPIRKEVQSKLDDRFGAGLFNVSVDEGNGSIYISVRR